MSEGCSGNCSSCSKGNCDDKLKRNLEGIKHKILVLSGKGGVGKSTVAASLALTLAKKGAKVGLLDVDFHGPSQPTLFSLRSASVEGDENGLYPAEISGLKIFSIGIVLDDADKAVIWRGPAKIGVLKQLLEDVQWGELDYLVLDFPPGTGDEVLSACQMITGDTKALIVTTPQEVALADCRKCVDFCRQVGVPIAGIIENMSGFVCPDCGHRHEIFSSGGGEALAKLAEAPLLAQIPLDPEFLKRADSGNIANALESSIPVKGEMDKAVSLILAAN